MGLFKDFLITPVWLRRYSMWWDRRKKGFFELLVFFLLQKAPQRSYMTQHCFWDFIVFFCCVISLPDNYFKTGPKNSKMKCVVLYCAQLEINFCPQCPANCPRLNNHCPKLKIFYFFILHNEYCQITLFQSVAALCWLTHYLYLKNHPRCLGTIRFHNSHCLSSCFLFTYLSLFNKCKPLNIITI